MSEKNDFNSFWEPSTPQGNTEDIGDTKINDVEVNTVQNATTAQNIAEAQNIATAQNIAEAENCITDTTNVDKETPIIKDVSQLISSQGSDADEKIISGNNTEANNGYYNRFYNTNNGGANNGNYNTNNGGANNGNYNPNNGGANNGYYSANNSGANNGYYNANNGGANNGYYNANNGGANNGYYNANNSGANNGYYNPNHGNYNWKQSSEKEEKKKKLIWLAIIGSVILLVAVCAGIWIDVFVRAYNMEEEEPGSFSESMDEFLGEDSEYNYDDSESDYDDSESDYDAYESEETVIDWDDQTWKDAHINYAKEDLGDEFYTSIVDCKDETVSYKIKDEYYEYYEEENDVCMRVHYIQLEGDLPNLEEINEHIMAESLYYVDEYEYDLEEYAEELEESDEPYIVNIDSYVTYNDNELISIVLEENCSSAIGNTLGLYGISINLATGTVLDNTSLISASDEFLEDFRARNEYQNGENAGSADVFSDDEIKNYMENEGTLIIFYTPLGMEIGYNYLYDEEIGWVSVTFTDYQKYLRSL